MSALVVVGDAGPAYEDPAGVRYLKAPYWCDDCEVGQSIEHCWLCAMPCRKLDKVRDRFFAGGAMAWPTQDQRDDLKAEGVVIA